MGCAFTPFPRASAWRVIPDGDADGDHKYTWDYRNRLLKVEEKQSGQWNTIVECEYDARGRRIRKEVTNKGSLNGTTRYLWGGGLSVAASRRPGDAGIGRAGQGLDWQCLEEEDGSGNLVARYTYAPGYIDAVAVQERDLNSDDDFLDSDEVAYYHSNTLFSAYALTNANEAVVERYEYDAYGSATVLDADGSTDADGLSDVSNPYLFTARRLDAESALMQYRHRHYDPMLGRFVSRDPAEYADEFNVYGYVSGRPTFSGDPNGLRTYEECKCYCDAACDAFCLIFDYMGCGPACKIYCMTICMLPNPHSKCYKPDEPRDCAISCKAQGSCLRCCYKLVVAGKIKPGSKEHTDCNRACKAKPEFPD